VNLIQIRAIYRRPEMGRKRSEALVTWFAVEVTSMMTCVKLKTFYEVEEDMENEVSNWSAQNPTFSEAVMEARKAKEGQQEGCL